MKTDRAHVAYCVKQSCAGIYTIQQAAQSCGLSAPQISVLKRKYRKEGDKAFIHGNKGRKPSTTIPNEQRAQIVDYYLKEFKGFNFVFFLKYLREEKNISVSYRTVYNILTAAGIHSPEKRRVPKKKEVHRPRYRRTNEGDLWQIDATPYDWFDCGQKYSLHGGIDDATGKITGLYICENECLFGYNEILRQTIENGGIPRSVYSDKHSVFTVNLKHKENLSLEEQLDGDKGKKTQWQKELEALHIEQILAHSPQAKGRIERLWRTLKGRLCWYFRRYNIHTVEQANIFLKEYIKKYNSEFAKTAQNEEIFYRQKSEFQNLNEILCVKVPRKTDVSGVFSFHGYRFQFLGQYAARKHIELYISEQDGVRAKYEGKFYPVSLLDPVQNCIGDNMPKVLENIIYKYFYRNAKQFSA